MRGAQSGFYMLFASLSRDARAVAVVVRYVVLADWLPVVWIQLRMRRFAQQAVERNEPLPRIYWRYLRIWVLLGIPAFFALVIVFYLMVAKPA